MAKTILLAAVAGLSLTSAACTSSGAMNTGERISQRGGDIGAYGKDWSDGQREAEQGAKLADKSTRNLADAEKDLARAREQMAKAERQIADAITARQNAERQIEDGNGQMRRAEAAYSSIRTGPSAVARDD